MDIGIGTSLPKFGQDTRYLLEHQRHQRDSILKECDEYEQRAIYLKNKIKEIENKIFNTPMGGKIKELVKENLSLSIDCQCLSIELDIHNQGMDARGPDVNPNHSPARPGISPRSPNGMINRNPPTNSPNVVTIDTTTYPYAQVVSSPNPMSPYPVQPTMPGVPTLPYPMTGNRSHQAPHPHDPARQFSMGPHSPMPHPAFYGYERQGSLSILNQVPPPGSQALWMQQQPNFPMTPTTPNPGPPVPPRPSDLPGLRPGSRPGRSMPTPPHRPVPPPPTPPKPNRSPNLERPRSSNDQLDQREEEQPAWKCGTCTFDNHSAMNSCEICNSPRAGPIGQQNHRSPHS